MKIKIVKGFTSKMYGELKEGQIISCSPLMAKSLVNSQLGVETDEPLVTRKKKTVNKKSVETAAKDIETTQEES